MNAPVYLVVTTTHFDRLLKKLASKHPEFNERLAEAAAILSLDPYNKSYRYQIKKLRDVAAGEGQFRLRSGRFRIRYDIVEREVVLQYCGLRREDTY
jgi:mRNA-degrading endonuclease RelE of RelBE toxin-antitoxin system